MSTIVVMPPAREARVAVAQPSHSGAAWLVDVHVAVDDAGQDRQRAVVGDRHAVAQRGVIVVVTVHHGGDAFAVNDDGAGLDAVWGDNRGTAKGESVHGCMLTGE